MLRGEAYDSRDPELIGMYWRARQLIHDFQQAMADPRRMEILQSVLGDLGDDVWIEPPFLFEYGPHISIGARTYINSQVVIQDCAEVRVGEDVLIGPGVKFCTATHPLESTARLQPDASGKTRYRTSSAPISVGNRCWIGAGAIILGGVHIGDDAVVGAGSLVNRDVMPGTLVFGTPARFVRQIQPS